jgi:hypothetical protein
MRQLIVNADDFGYSSGVNRGILEAHRQGIVTSTSVMVNQRAAPAGTKQALTDAPDLGLGLHLILTQGRPVLPPGQVPSLVGGDGRFFHIGEWADHVLDAVGESPPFPDPFPHARRREGEPGRLCFPSPLVGEGLRMGATQFANSTVDRVRGCAPCVDPKPDGSDFAIPATQGEQAAELRQNCDNGRRA